MHTGQTGLSGVSGLVGGFNPAQVPGLQDWLKADAGTYDDVAQTVLVVTDNAQVGGWQDQSGNGNAATQITAAQRPTLKLGIQNGLPVLRLDGVDDGFLLSAAIRDLLLGTSQHVFVVAKFLTLTSGAWIFNVTDSTGSTRKGLECVTPPTNRVVIYNTGVQASLMGTQTLTSAFNVWELQAQGSSLSLWVDGIQDGITKTDAVAASLPGSSASLGFRSSNSTGFANLDLGEILVFNTVLSGSNRAGILNYLKRWGTS
jgi:hypothetical protein